MWDQKQYYFFLTLGHQNTGYGSVFRKKAESGFEKKESGFEKNESGFGFNESSSKTLFLLMSFFVKVYIFFLNFTIYRIFL
jgi:hypothetical protein